MYLLLQPKPKTKKHYTLSWLAKPYIYLTLAIKNTGKDAEGRSAIKGLHEAPSFKRLLSMTSRGFEIMVNGKKKGIICSAEDKYILPG